MNELTDRGAESRCPHVLPRQDRHKILSMYGVERLRRNTLSGLYPTIPFGPLKVISPPCPSTGTHISSNRGGEGRAPAYATVPLHAPSLSPRRRHCRE